MAGTRSALIVATYEYDDQRLAELRAPEQDAEALAGVLSDADIGGFDVTTVVNRPWHEVSLAVARFFRDRRAEDLLLLHFSCHGLKDDSGELYFAATDTTLDLLDATAIPSASVNRAMNRSRAGRVVLLLDCCYSGAFARGMTAKAGASVDGADHLGGHGRAVITASTALQYAFEGDEMADGGPGSSAPSVFTSALVRGLRTGDADRDLDGWVSLDELYAYVHDEVTRVNPDQTPTKWAFDVEGDLQVARRGRPVSTPAELPGPLRESMASLFSWERGSAVEPLTELLHGEHPGLALAARQALEEMAAGDDSDKVKAGARRALGVEPATGLSTGPAPARGPVPAAAAAAAPELAPELAPEPKPEPEPPPGVEEPERPSGRRRLPPRGRALVAAAVVAVAALAVGLALLRNITNGGGDGGGSGGGGSGGGGGTELSADAIVVPQEVDGRRRLVAAEADGSTTLLVEDRDVGLASINRSRTAMTYLLGTGNATVPYLASGFTGPGSFEVDRPLLGDHPLDCPYTHRTGWSSDDVHLAVICLDESDAPTLRIATVDGDLSKPLLAWDSLSGGPSWGDDGNIYFVAEAGPGSAYDAIYEIPNGGGSPSPAATEDGRSLSHPDWGEPGLLYLDSPERNLPGRIELKQTDGKVVELATDGPVTSATWSPDYTAVAWQTKDQSGDRTLWTAPFIDSSQGPPRLGPTTRYDAAGLGDMPAWGSR